MQNSEEFNSIHRFLQIDYVKFSDVIDCSPSDLSSMFTILSCSANMWYYDLIIVNTFEILPLHSLTCICNTRFHGARFLLPS